MASENRQMLGSDPHGIEIPFQNLCELLEKQAADRGNKILYQFLPDGETETETITYQQMYDRAVKVAGAIQALAAKGERVIMLFPPGIEFIVSLFGCFLSGTVGVPVYPPRKNRGFERFDAIFRDAQPTVVLGTEKILEEVRKAVPDESYFEGIFTISYEETQKVLPVAWLKQEIFPHELAILQYTSGSTGNPNGVMVSHGNILANSEFIRQAFGHDENLVGMNWLPGFHDMGLIGALIQPVYVGGSNAIIPPAAFLMRPQNWLHSIGNYQAITAGGPNFAFDYCVERIPDDELAGIDLSSVRPLFCGAEPIRRTTLETFAQKFAPTGFSIRQFYPCYGLAEATLIVTGGHLDHDPVFLKVDARRLEAGAVEVVDEMNTEGSRMLTACGWPMAGTRIAIVDPETFTVLERGRTGEIWVDGPGVAQGYWNDPDKTKTFFNVSTHDGDGPYLRTGDLGFIEEGQLYVTGRIKDLIIIRGLNHYPQDIEKTTEDSHEAIQPAASAAFAIEAEGTETLAIVAEIRRTHLRLFDEEEVVRSIRQAISDEHQIETGHVLLVRIGSIPKTSSGKIRRFECRSDLLAGNLNVIAEWHRPMDPEADIPEQEMNILNWMVQWVAKELKVDANSIDVSAPVNKIGLDSILGVVMAREAEKQFGVEWPIDLFMEELSLEKIAAKGARLIREKR